MNNIKHTMYSLIALYSDNFQKCNGINDKIAFLNRIDTVLYDLLKFIHL